MEVANSVSLINSMEATSHDAFVPPEIVDSHKLLIFYMVARCGSVGDAARNMHLTRSALSHALRSLERDLGCELFHRIDRRLVLSPCGQQLMPMAESVLKHMGEIRAQLRLKQAASDA